MPFVRVAAVDDLWDGEMRGCTVSGQKVLLVRLNDAVYAYEDRCAHLGIMLSKGTLDGCVLTCSGHQWQYDVCTGGGVNPESTRLKRLPTEIVSGDVFVDAGGVRS